MDVCWTSICRNQINSSRAVPRDLRCQVSAEGSAKRTKHSQARQKGTVQPPPATFKCDFRENHDPTKFKQKIAFSQKMYFATSAIYLMSFGSLGVCQFLFRFFWSFLFFGCSFFFGASEADELGSPRWQPVDSAPVFFCFFFLFVRLFFRVVALCWGCSTFFGRSSTFLFFFWGGGSALFWAFAVFRSFVVFVLRSYFWLFVLCFWFWVPPESQPTKKGCPFFPWPLGI